MGNFRIFVLFPFFLMLMKRLRNLRPVVKSLLLLSLRYTFVTRRFYCWKKKKFVLKRERETELSNSWICIALKKSTWKWLKVWKKGNRYNSVATVTVTDNLKKNSFDVHMLILYIQLFCRWIYHDKDFNHINNRGV